MLGEGELDDTAWIEQAERDQQRIRAARCIQRAYRAYAFRKQVSEVGEAIATRKTSTYKFQNNHKTIETNEVSESHHGKDEQEQTATADVHQTEQKKDTHYWKKKHTEGF